MRGSELAEAMAVAVDRLVSARKGASALDLEAYKSKMQMRNIPEDKRLAGFPRVVLQHIHTEMVEIQAGCRN